MWLGGVYLVGVAYVVAMISGCVSLDELVPPVDQRVVAMGVRAGIAPQSLERGRQIYLNRCIGCHSIEPVGRYSVDHRRKTISEMSEMAKLDKAQETDLLDYLLTARQFIETLEK